MKSILTILLLFIATLGITQPVAPDIFLSARFEMTPTLAATSEENINLNAVGAKVTKTGLNFPSTGTYRVDLVAFSYNAIPVVKVDVDGVSVNITITGSNPKSPGIFSALLPSITAGTHTLTISLTNYSAMAGISLVYLTRSASATPYVYPTTPALKIIPGQFLKARHFSSGHIRGFNKGGLFASNVDMTDLKATGANIVRLWVKVDTVPSGNSFVFRSGDTATLRSNLNYLATMGGVNVVITLQVFPEDAQVYWGTDARAVNYRKSISERLKDLADVYKNNTTIAAWDPINEPRGPAGSFQFNYAEFIRFHQQMVDSIRKVDVNHVIAIEVENNDMCAKFIPLPDTNLIYTPHGYSSTKITLQGLYSNTVRNKYPTTTSTANLAAPWDINNLSLQHAGPRLLKNRFNVPIWNGEFGCVNWAPMNNAGEWTSTKWTDDNIKLMEAEGFSWVVQAWRSWEGADNEIPSSFYLPYPFTNAAPSGFTGSQQRAARTFSAPTMVMLIDWFAKNVDTTVIVIPPDTIPEPPDTIPTPPVSVVITIPQSQMSHTGGQYYSPEFWWFNTKQASATKSVPFSSAGNYKFELTAYAVKGSPDVTLYMDGVSKGKLTWTGTSTSTKYFNVTNISANSHSVVIKITNFNGKTNIRVGTLYFTKY